MSMATTSVIRSVSATTIQSCSSLQVRQTGLLQIMGMNGFKSLSVSFPSFLAASQNVNFGRELWLLFLPT
jgi:hypothetical protein